MVSVLFNQDINIIPRDVTFLTKQIQNPKIQDGFSLVQSREASTSCQETLHFRQERSKIQKYKMVSVLFNPGRHQHHSKRRHIFDKKDQKSKNPKSKMVSLLFNPGHQHHTKRRHIFDKKDPCY